VHQESKFAFGYSHFGGPIAVMVARLVLNSTGPFYFTVNALSVIVSSLFSKIIEDGMVLLLVSRGPRPKWVATESAKEYIKNLPGDSILSNTIVDDDGTAIRRRFGFRPFPSVWISMTVNNIIVFLTFSALLLLVSLNFLLGTCSEPVVGISNGGILWPLDGNTSCPA
jgi:hypothetical protein